MSPKAIWFTTIGISTLTLVASIPLGQAAAKLWKPEVAHAAKVTMHLVKSKSLNPAMLTRRSRSAPLGQSVYLPKATAENPAAAGHSQQISLEYLNLTQPASSNKASAYPDQFSHELVNYQIAAQEFQPLRDSSKMAN